MTNAPTPDHHVVVVGAGFAGLGAAIRLEQEGFTDFVVLERGHDVGGTWRDNTYPGCACDVPSHLYSFSFAPNPSWSSTFSRQEEIYAYLRACADRFGVRDKMRFGVEVLELRWDEPAQLWRLSTSAGPVTARVVIGGIGGLVEPSVPELPGLSSFEGRTFHSAEWDHSYDLDGKRVAVVGTGASAIQFVPQIQGRVASLTLFQRTPPWIIPRTDRPLTSLEKRVYKRVPALQLAMRAGIYWARESFVIGFRHPFVIRRASKLAAAHLHRQVPDRELRRKLRPRYAMGCKRILISNDYYPSLTQPNVSVVTEGIASVERDAVVSSDGARHEVDAIIFGTGFHVTDRPATRRIFGRDQERSLGEIWDGAPVAHRGTTVAGFPNLFQLTGPNTGLGHTSVVFMIESQVNYVLDALRVMRERGLGAVDVRPDAQAAYNAAIDRQMQGTVWQAGGCASWYIDRTGRNSTLWPTFTWGFRRATRRFDAASYRLEPLRPAPAGAPEPQPALA